MTITYPDGWQQMNTRGPCTACGAVRRYRWRSPAGVELCCACRWANA